MNLIEDKVLLTTKIFDGGFAAFCWAMIITAQHGVNVLTNNVQTESLE
jgi:hypothetical protein